MDPVFSAVSVNANNLYTLLQCIGFSPKATVQITPDGIRVSVEDGRVIQGLAFLDKALFTSYTFNPPREQTNRHRNDDSDDAADDGASEEDVVYPHFVISLSALLETLKIFVSNDTSASGQSRSTTNSMQPPSSSASSAFNAPALLLDRSCTIQYLYPGSPLSITLSETGVKTTCELTTYEPDDDETDIPLQRDAIVMKIIMRSAWLHNAVSELDSTNPNVLRISASSKNEPYFALSGSGGPFSESTVEFSVDEEQNQQRSLQSGRAPPSSRTNQSRNTGNTKQAPTVTETFYVSPSSSSSRSHIKQDYRFPLIRKASRAMAVASKVSIRGDRQGVLSLQFMVEFNDGNGSGGSSFGLRAPPGHNALGAVGFVDFRFVPLLDEDGSGGETEGTGDEVDDD